MMWSRRETTSMSSPKTAAAKPARRTKAGQATAAPSGATAPAKAGSMPEAAAGPAADDAGLSAEARRLAAEIERALAAGRPEASARGLPGPDGGFVPELRRAGRAGGGGLAAQGARQCHLDRHHADGEWIAALRQPCGLRTRHVAELDGPLNDTRFGTRARTSLLSGDAPWTSSLIAADAYRSRS